MSPADVPVRSGRVRNRFRKFLTGSLPGVATTLVKFVCSTLRLTCVDEHHFFGTEGGKILSMWHGRAIPPTARMRGVDLSVLISLSRDGEMINTILSGMGYKAIRGSSGPSGARAMASCIKLLRAGGILVVTPDGPRGPSGVLQPGVVTMARKSGAAIVPMGAASRPRLLMKSWDRFEMPLPFSKAIILFGPPVYIPEDADEATIECLRLSIQTEMRRLQDEADRRLKQPTFGEIAAKNPS